MEVTKSEDVTSRKSDASDCGIKGDDVLQGVKCTVTPWSSNIPVPQNLGVNCSVRVDWLTTHCFSGQNLISILVADIVIDYDLLAQTCQELVFPTDPTELELVLLEFERNIGQFIERLSYNLVLDFYRFSVPYLQDVSVVVTKVSSSCFQFCWIPPSDPTELFGPTKVYCNNDICCFQSRNYCTSGNGSPIIIENLAWSTGSSCEDLDSNNPVTSCYHDCDIIF